MSETKKLTIEERLYANETRADHVSHLAILDPSACPACEAKPCVSVCPARTYSWGEETQKIAIAHENCLECGACRAACPKAVISWKNPMGGCGICYRYG
ncbi:4Fe-4S dicluster domain-containing protein [bacterium]|nr:MAG: 4Fe-4S dicluster domain-containing protein [bacterium]